MSINTLHKGDDDDDDDDDDDEDDDDYDDDDDDNNNNNNNNNRENFTCILHYNFSIECANIKNIRPQSSVHAELDNDTKLRGIQ